MVKLKLIRNVNRGKKYLMQLALFPKSLPKARDAGITDEAGINRTMLHYFFKK
jgi:hypothetical protein